MAFSPPVLPGLVCTHGTFARAVGSLAKLASSARPLRRPTPSPWWLTVSKGGRVGAAR